MELCREKELDYEDEGKSRRGTKRSADELTSGEWEENLRGGSLDIFLSSILF